jgi:MSHA pilin protein MshD
MLTTIKKHQGFTLIELVAFIVVIGISVVAIGSVFQHSIVRIHDPLINNQLLTMAQSQLDEVLSRKYDENTPTGGVPACVPLTTCAGIGLDIGESIADVSSLDDVDDFNGYIDIPLTGYHRQVFVIHGGSDFGIDEANAKRITVTVTSPQGEAITLSVYRFNF